MASGHVAFEKQYDDTVHFAITLIIICSILDGKKKKKKEPHTKKMANVS